MSRMDNSSKFSVFLEISYLPCAHAIRVINGSLSVFVETLSSFNIAKLSFRKFGKSSLLIIQVYHYINIHIHIYNHRANIQGN